MGCVRVWARSLLSAEEVLSTGTVVRLTESGRLWSSPCNSRWSSEMQDFGSLGSTRCTRPLDMEALPSSLGMYLQLVSASALQDLQRRRTDGLFEPTTIYPAPPQCRKAIWSPHLQRRGDQWQTSAISPTPSFFILNNPTEHYEHVIFMPWKVFLTYI